MSSVTQKIQAVILGASGYTGAELVRLLSQHDQVKIAALTADRNAGRRFDELYPHLAHLDLPVMVKAEDADLAKADIVFCCLPHGTTQEVIAALPDGPRVVDLSADFRLADTGLYETWYGHPHRAPKLQSKAVYGLTELARSSIKDARLVANPGCYPTAALLPLIPLVDSGVISSDEIIIDAKSGVTGAGRAARESSLFAEVSDGFQAYGIAAHRHAPEIEQGLSNVAGHPVTVTFTPHLVPMNRGIFSTAYVRFAGGAGIDDLRSALAECYADEAFVRILPPGQTPSTRHVRGSNFCHIAIFEDRVKGRAIVLSVIDNLVKGASGQALQNMNLMFRLEETMGLGTQPLCP